MKLFCIAGPARRGNSGFTLVELLVVVAIISILAAMLLPVLSKALETARLSACASNEKQIGVSIRLYADDYDGYITDPVTTAWPHFCWPELLTKYAVGSENGWRHVPYFTWQGPGGTNGVLPEPIWSRVMALHNSKSIVGKLIFNCPALRPSPQTSGHADADYQYLLNRMLLDDNNQPNPIWNSRRKAWRLDSIRKAVLLVAEGEGGWGGFPWYFNHMRHGYKFTPPKVWYETYLEAPGRANYLWTDLHVSTAAATELWVRKQHSNLQGSTLFNPNQQ
mgnify:CR=1 FL=1